MRADQIESLFCNLIAERIAVVSLVGDQRYGASFRMYDLLQSFRCQSHFGRRRRVDGTCQRYALAIRHHHPLCTLSTLGFSDVGAPFFAGAKLPSMNNSSQFMRPFSSSSSMKACTFRQTRRHLPIPKADASMCSERETNRASPSTSTDRNTHRIPSKQARSSARGRPPFTLVPLAE